MNDSVDAFLALVEKYADEVELPEVNSSATVEQAKKCRKTE